MILIQRRWFVPSEKREEFRTRWQTEILPEVNRQPGFVRAELYESSIRGHWLTSMAWEDEPSRAKAFERLSPVYKAFAPYERFEPEILTLL